MPQGPKKIITLGLHFETKTKKMLYALTIAAGLFFIAHVSLLLASFAQGRFYSVRYFLSHVTLWITGFMVFFLALLFEGRGISAFLDYFDTPLKKAMILAGALVLSLIAHSIVKFLVLSPRRRQQS